MKGQWMDALELAGRIIMENGGETYRVEETVARMGCALGLREVQAFAVPSGIFLSFVAPGGESVSRILRVHGSGTDLSRVDAVNDISRRVERGELNADTALEELRGIAAASRTHAAVKQTAAAWLCGFGFALMFAGSITDALTAGTAAALAQGLELLLTRLHLQGMITALFRSFATVLLPMLFLGFVMPGNTEAAVGGALMPLLPGLAMTKAAQDTLRGDMVSGASHLLQAILIAALIAGGAVMASGVYSLAGGALL